MKWNIEFEHPMLIDKKRVVVADKVTIASAPMVLVMDYVRDGIVIDNPSEFKIKWVVPK